jgi:hypothetical protein
MLFAAKGDVRRAEVYAPAQTAHVLARSCRKFEKHCYKELYLLGYSAV